MKSKKRNPTKNVYNYLDCPKSPTTTTTTTTTTTLFFSQGTKAPTKEIVCFGEIWKFYNVVFDILAENV